MISKLKLNERILEISFREKEEEWKCLESLSSTLLKKEYIPMTILEGKDGFILTFSDGKYNAGISNKKRYEILLFKKYLHKEDRSGLITTRYEIEIYSEYRDSYQELLKELKGFNLKKDLTNLYRLI
jgi:hypothetical protein